MEIALGFVGSLDENGQTDATHWHNFDSGTIFLKFQRQMKLLSKLAMSLHNDDGDVEDAGEDDDSYHFVFFFSSLRRQVG